MFFNPLHFKILINVKDYIFIDISEFLTDQIKRKIKH